MRLRGPAPGERPLAGTQLPTFGAAVPGQDVVIVWVIAANYEQLAIRTFAIATYDASSFFGG